jgi:hypothetical protein
MDLTEGSETSEKLNLRIFFIKPLKVDLTGGSETSAKLNLTPGKYPKENIQVPYNCFCISCSEVISVSCFVVEVIGISAGT